MEIIVMVARTSGVEKSFGCGVWSFLGGSQSLSLCWSLTSTTSYNCSLNPHCWWEHQTKKESFKPLAVEINMYCSTFLFKHNLIKDRFKIQTHENCYLDLEKVKQKKWCTKSSCGVFWYTISRSGSRYTNGYYNRPIYYTYVTVLDTHAFIIHAGLYIYYPPPYVRLLRRYFRPF